jgi:SulP family sulfate permease
MSLYRISKNLIAGLVIGIITLNLNISFALLLFSAPILKPFLAIAICSTFIGTIVLNLFHFVFSNSKINLYISQILYALLGNIMIARAINQMQGAVLEDILATLMMLLIVFVLLSGLSMFLVGFFKLGNLIQFFPFPVVCGFMAGQSILLMLSGFHVLTDIHFTLNNLTNFFNIEIMFKWGPAFFYALVMAYFTLKYKHSIILPGFLIASVVLFYLYLFFFGIDIYKAAQSGYMLINSKHSDSLWLIPSLKVFQGNINWNLIVYQLPVLFTLIMLILLNVLFFISSLQHMTKQEVAVNREFKNTGLANVFISLLGGLGGYVAPILTKTNVDMKIKNKLGQLMLILTHCFALGIGTSFLAYYPRFTYAVLILYFSFLFIYEWLFCIQSKLNWLDYGLVLMISGVIAFYDLFTGLASGFLFSLLMFFWKYSHVSPLKEFLHGSFVQSHSIRSIDEQIVLRKYGEEVLIPVISGYLFFGNTSMMLNRIRTKIKKSKPKVKYLVIDFSKTSGIEVSSLQKFAELIKFVKKQHIIVLFTQLPLKTELELKQFMNAQQDKEFKSFHHLDNALKWCEDELLAAHPVVEKKNLCPFTNMYQTVLHEYLEKIEVESGEIIYSQHQPSQYLYWVEQGELDIWRHYTFPNRLCIATIGVGCVLGEVSLFLNRPHSTTAISNTNTILYRLSRENLEKIFAEHIDLAFDLIRYVLRLQSDRMIQAEKTLQLIKKDGLSE